MFQWPLAGLALGVALCCFAEIGACQGIAQTIATCGVPLTQFPLGTVNPVTQNQSGLLCVNATVSANTTVAAQSTLPTLAPGAQTPTASLAGAAYVQPVFGSASGGGTQVDITHGLPTNCISGCASAPAITPAASTTSEASHLFKNTAGTLFSLEFTNQGAAGFLMWLDVASVPADGAVSGVKGCVAVAAGSSSSPSSASIAVAPSVAGMSATTGIVAVYSTTGCFTKTAGAAVGYFQAVFQ